jgi:hypothetical protein
MASVLKIKRRVTGASGAPTAGSLKGGELAYNEVSDQLFYGKGDNGSGVATSIVQVGGVSLDYVTLATTQTVTGDKTFSGLVDLTGTIKVDGVELTASATELDKLAGVTAGTATAGKALVVDANKDLNLNGGDLTAQDITCLGNLTVQGTTTSVESTVVQIKDKAIELAYTASPTDTSANDGGIIVKGATDKSILWKSASSAFTSSEHVDVASGKSYKVDGTEVLSGSALGSGVTGSSLTSLGVISSGSWQGSTVAIAYGGTGATSAADARTNLGLVIGTDVQAYDAELSAIAGLTSAADKGIMFSGSGTAATFDLSSFGRSLVDDADASAARSTLGVVIGTDVQAYDAELAAIAGLTSAADKGIMFSGSGTAATYDLSSFGRTLAGSSDAAAARTSLGLGSMAVQAADSVAITGGSIDGVTLDGGSF